MEKWKTQKLRRIRKSVTKKHFKFESYIAGNEYVQHIIQTLGNVIIGINKVLGEFQFSLAGEGWNRRRSPEYFQKVE